MKQPGEIRVSGGRRLTVDIEGLIGVPEWWTTDDENDRAATYENFRAQVERIGRSGARRIQVNIRSTGGNIHDALLIYETLCALAAEGAEITTVCYGYTASAATVVAQAATPGRRVVAASALYLIHNSMTSLEGNCFDAERTARLLGKTDERIAEIYAARSGAPAERFRELMARNGGRGEWLSADEAVAAGLADRVGRSSPLSAVRDKMAAAVAGLFRSPSVPPAEKTGIETPSESAEESSVPVLETAEGDPRLRVRASTVRQREDPAVIPVGETGDAFGFDGLGGLGTADGVCSRNGRAYENDATRLRTGY